MCAKRRGREREREPAGRADHEGGSRSPTEGPKSIKTLIERAEKTMEPGSAKAVGMDGLDNRKISWPIAGNPPEHTERVGKGTFLRAAFLRRAQRKIRGTDFR